MTTPDPTGNRSSDEDDVEACANYIESLLDHRSAKEVAAAAADCLRSRGWADGETHQEEVRNANRWARKNADHIEARLAAEAKLEDAVATSVAAYQEAAAVKAERDAALARAADAFRAGQEAMRERAANICDRQCHKYTDGGKPQHAWAADYLCSVIRALPVGEVPEEPEGET